MERRTSSRAHVDFPVHAHVDGYRHGCRAIDLSASGMVVERTPSLASRGAPETGLLELDLRDGQLPIRVRARTVWSKGRLLAVRFIAIHDVDRLAIAEQLDQCMKQRQTLH
jgi:hypothetical protein